MNHILYNPGNSYRPQLFYDAIRELMFTHGGPDGEDLLVSSTSGTPSWSTVSDEISGSYKIHGSYADGNTVFVTYGQQSGIAE